MPDGRDSGKHEERFGSFEESIFQANLLLNETTLTNLDMDILFFFIPVASYA